MYTLFRLRAISAFMLLAVCFLAGCSGTATTVQANPVTVTLASASGSVLPNASTSAIQVVVGRSSGNQNSISLTTSGAPDGITAAITQPFYGTYGSVVFSTIVNMKPGVYPITITASDGIVSASASYSLTVMEADALSISPASSTVLALQNGVSASDSFTITRSFGNTNAVTVSTSGLPSGLTATLTQPGTGNTGAVTFATGATPASAGTYNITLTASDGTATNSNVIAVDVGIVATVQNAVNTAQGVFGYLKQFMSTGFQPSAYNNSFFTTFPGTADLVSLGAQHIRIQAVHDTIPWKANSTPQSASDWNFAPMDQTVQPVLGIGDNSPTFQIEVAPSFLCDADGHFVFNAANLQLFAQYAQNLVRYYNTGGFDWGGKHFQSASSQHITWWAIFNEPNLNNITASQYVQIYNTLVPAMLSVDPSLKFVAVELSDYTGAPEAFLPQLVLPAASGGLSAQVDAVSTHFYGTCNQKTIDATVFTQVAQFVSDINYFRNELKTRSDLANVPVWVTENNVNADFQTTTGDSNCNAGQLFVNDPRGTSAFFTSWRPYVFSQLGKAGNQSLYHFLYEGSTQFGEVINTTAGKTLAYWTDAWLQRTFPLSSNSTGASILKTTTTEATSSVETLAVHNEDNSVSLMVTNLGVASPLTDNNGNGAPRTVVLDLSALGSFSSATEVDLNANTSTVTGPVSETITPASTMTLSFAGYGSTLLVLKP